MLPKLGPSLILCSKSHANLCHDTRAHKAECSRQYGSTIFRPKRYEKWRVRNAGISADGVPKMKDSRFLKAARVMRTYATIPGLIKLNVRDSTDPRFSDALIHNNLQMTAIELEQEGWIKNERESTY
ncbi:TPA_exp: hypothetical protein A8136_0013 [Trichophyton benhamiae CBS 112371]|nr:TPA_exp: hypothetical protein A8136_0013 [Trichophyton benhamiae CBS 112371]